MDHNAVYDLAWRDGVDRWYGQAMKQEHVDLIVKYYNQAPDWELPLWVRGLHYVITGQHVERDRYQEWDYGLNMDLELLCHHRRGRLLFEFSRDLWQILGARRDRLQKI